MIDNTKGYIIPENSDELSVFSIAYQYAMIFASKIYNYHIPSIQGLISFSSEVNYLYSLSPYFSDFLEKGLYELQQTNEMPKMLDSLYRACKEIIDFRKDDKGNEKFKNAVSRILMISYGEDFKSNSTPTEIAQKLVQNNIVVDSIVFNDDCNKNIATVSHLTNGLCILPTDASDALSLIEQDAFLNYKQRKIKIVPLIKNDKSTLPSRLINYPKKITPDFIKKIDENAYYDTEILNKDFYNATLRCRLVTPSHVCSKNQHNKIDIRRYRLILRELHLAAEIFDENSDLYDQDMKIFTVQSCLDHWRVFILNKQTNKQNKIKKNFIHFKFSFIFFIFMPAISNHCLCT